MRAILDTNAKFADQSGQQDAIARGQDKTSGATRCCLSAWLDRLLRGARWALQVLRTQFRVSQPTLQSEGGERRPHWTSSRSGTTRSCKRGDIEDKVTDYPEPRNLARLGARNQTAGIPQYWL